MPPPRAFQMNCLTAARVIVTGTGISQHNTSIAASGLTAGAWISGCECVLCVLVGDAGAPSLRIDANGTVGEWPPLIVSCLAVGRCEWPDAIEFRRDPALRSSSSLS
jgi:hypothetical protein